MNRLIIVLLLASIAVACRKDQFIYDSSNAISISADTIRFDTVFTNSGSITQAVKIFNLNDGKLLISSIRLGGGGNSPFKININGQPGPQQQQLELAAGDSLYVFVQVFIDPTNTKNPFLVRDSIQIICNGVETPVQLEAYGQNAHYLKNQLITGDVTWINDLPYIITGELEIGEGARLTVGQGVRIYAHANASIRIHGSASFMGNSGDSNNIIITSDRMDMPYNMLAGSWQGIYFDSTSQQNEMNWVVIKNAVNAISLNGHNQGATQLRIRNSVIDNSKEQAILSNGSSLYAENCLLTNSGQDLTIKGGGSYRLIHCTLAGFSNQQVQHQQPLIFIADSITEEGQIRAYQTSASFENCIIWGDEGFNGNEVITERKAALDFEVKFTNCLMKSEGLDPTQQFQDCLLNLDPGFANTDFSAGPYDFHLREGSPAIDKGIQTAVLTDLDNRTRSLPDLGCYEYLP